MIETLIVYSLLTSAMFYLGSRALITRWLWQRYPQRLAVFFDCAACSGAWYGLLVDVGAKLAGFGLLPPWWSPVIAMLCMLVLTPIVAGLMQRGLDSLGTIASDDQQP